MAWATRLMAVETREQWLRALVDQLAPMYAEFGGVPPVRISIGFPSGGRRAKAIGECWEKEADREGYNQLFVHPTLDDPLRIADVVAHELIHAVVGVGAKHGGPFKRVAHAIGLEGPMKSTVAGPKLRSELATVVAELGPLPHASLKVAVTERPKQSTRMLKCECPECGYTIRTTQKWLDEGGPPLCPLCTFEVIPGLTAPVTMVQP